MSAWDELASTGPGTETVQLIKDLTGKLVRTRGFPPPPHHRRWDNRAIEDFIGGMFAGKNGSWISEVQALATDQGSLERVLLRTIEHWLIDQAKSTTAGKMRRRLRSLYAKHDRFVNAKKLLAGEDGWTTTDFGNAVWQGDLQQLYRKSVHTATTPLEPLNTAGPTSKHNRAVIIEYSLGVFSAALGALREQLLARFVVERFGLEHHEAELAEAEAEKSQPDPAQNLEVQLAAEHISGQLTQDDEIVLALYETPGVLASRLQIPVAEAQEMIRSLLLRLRPHCASTDVGRAALAVVIERASARL